LWVYINSAWSPIAAAGLCAARYTTNAGLTLAASTATTVVFEDLGFDTDSAYNTSTGEFTVPATKAGKYLVTANVTTSAASSWAANDSLIIAVDVASSVVAQHRAITQVGSVSFPVISAVSVVLDLAASAVVRVRATQNSTTSKTLNTTNVDNHFSIIRIG
jgi:hypothetical protein